MKFEKFEEIIAWKKSKETAVVIYRVFSHSRDFSFREQIQRAAVSISNNIAEGFERKGNKEFVKFLYIAKGSAAEVRSMLYLALDLQYIDKNQFDGLYQSCTEVTRIISALIKSLKE